ncbi:DUF4240 domain-containing protein [Undibacterium sp. SXout11W]|uniref:DUF4240 domain-containing protein n=1 Tax=Undibacterium sp. SXout11W TaxID=3413050 RepID=UPI003BF3BBAD
MTIDEFWDLVEQCNDEEYPDDKAKELLYQCSPDEILEFGCFLELLQCYAYRSDIQCAAHMLCDASADDRFEYFLRGLIAMGRDVFDSAITNADTLHVLWGCDDIENEEFGWVARKVYAKKLDVDLGIAFSLIDEKFEKKEKELFLKQGNIYKRQELPYWDFDDEKANRKNLPILSSLYYAKSIAITDEQKGK